MRDKEKTLGKLVDHQRVCYLGSVDERGCPAIKAMFRPRRREGLAVFYFGTNTSSWRVSQFLQNPRACLYFCDRRFFRGLLLQGWVEVLHDPALKAALWEEGDEQYYPLGVEDPDYCVLRFTAEAGRYYSSLQSQDIAIA